MLSRHFLQAVECRGDHLVFGQSTLKQISWVLYGQLNRWSSSENESTSISKFFVESGKKPAYFVCIPGILPYSKVLKKIKKP